ncbi:MAG: hypothetical protein A2812_00020 [Candidatus Staskawiczbacteria bacterium RIFCSPHIGHO2_01_FULL_36_16]|uniref:EfeO-type cupredoxin-like domain-containing protein n=1 Tax=Candidatus Staskawiczbacteria bacterium RIFCSPHIGHO2_01_FULL_36_16 TaxID=1802200 RepID=A0A1G2HTE9_9BACT|nr:MAG: hypothetical protein A2812_00020 [Candidatus Staskawiczbacteria bacterium RIFCSPHIGHO2_01_FULL_36_16]
MNKKIIIPAIIIGIFAVAAVIAFNKTNQTAENPVVTENKESTVKEFTMTSFYEIVDGQPRPQYSLKEITVNKGDSVRIKITVTKGMHDFKIDEFSVYADTKELNKEYVVEFTADKVGEFIYYCAKSGHRANGHWGTLIVTE